MVPNATMFDVNLRNDRTLCWDVPIERNLRIQDPHGIEHHGGEKRPKDSLAAAIPLPEGAHGHPHVLPTPIQSYLRRLRTMPV